MDSKLFDVFSNLTEEEIVEISEIKLDCPIDKLTIERILTTSLLKVGLLDEEVKPKNLKKKLTLWKKVAVAAVFLIMFSTILSTTGSAQYLLNTWISRVNIGDGNKEIVLNEKIGLIHINENASKNDLPDITLKQAEDVIGIDFLDSIMYTSNVLSYRPLILDKEIEMINLWYPSCVAYDGSKDKYISGDFMLLTVKATKSVMPNEDIDATGQKEFSISYKSSTLNTTVIVYGVKWSKSRLTAVFDYKNVHYTFIGNNVSETEMIKFIESLK
jgi:hypothetical protein